jgi:hypothetical protein
VEHVAFTQETDAHPGIPRGIKRQTPPETLCDDDLDLIKIEFALLVFIQSVDIVVVLGNLPRIVILDVVVESQL